MEFLNNTCISLRIISYDVAKSCDKLHFIFTKSFQFINNSRCTERHTGNG